LDKKWEARGFSGSHLPRRLIMGEVCIRICKAQSAKTKEILSWLSNCAPLKDTWWE